MSNTVSDRLLFHFGDFVAAHTGLHFPGERLGDLAQGIVSAAREFGFEDTESCIRWLMSSPLTRERIEILASHLTIGETYFFRGKESFDILEEQILPELINRRQRERRLRIWSAGCCTGEEPYSIAILLSKMIYDLTNWNITILATDINPHYLRKAAEGRYSKWSFRSTPAWIKDRYFKRDSNDYYQIIPDIKKMVTFSYLNLAEDIYPSLLNNNAMDVIFCRNVLMYFAPDQTKKVINNLYLSLVDGGWLIVSPSETSHILFRQFEAVSFPGAILYRKAPRRPQDASAGVEEWESGRRRDAFDDAETRGNQTQRRRDAETRRQNVEPRTSDVERRTLRTSNVNPQSEQSAATNSLYLEALALYEQGLYQEAAEKLLASLADNRDQPAIYLLLARTYANQGKLVEALEWCEKLIAMNRLDPVSRHTLAMIYLEQDRVEEAIRSLKHALYLDQSFVLAHFALGNLTRRQGKLKESNKHFQNALALLSNYRQEEILPESGGMTAGRLMEIIRTAIYREAIK